MSVAEFVDRKLDGFELRQQARAERRASNRQSPSRPSRKTGTQRPAIPATVLESITLHRRCIHHTDSILTQFRCDECVRLEVLYAEALWYHVGQKAAEVILARRVDGARELRKTAGGAA